MKGHVGSIILGIVLALVVGAFLWAGYYGATSHSDTKVCHEQKFTLGVVDKLATAAGTLVLNDNNLSDQQKQEFITQFNKAHAEIALHMQHLNCTAIQDSQNP